MPSREIATQQLVSPSSHAQWDPPVSVAHLRRVVRPLRDFATSPFATAREDHRVRGGTRFVFVRMAGPTARSARTERQTYEGICRAFRRRHGVRAIRPFSRLLKTIPRRPADIFVSNGYESYGAGSWFRPHALADSLGSDARSAEPSGDSSARVGWTAGVWQRGRPPTKQKAGGISAARPEC